MKGCYWHFLIAAGSSLCPLDPKVYLVKKAVWDWNRVKFINLNKENISQLVSSVAQLCLTLCDPMNRSTPGLPVHHQLPEFAQTHVHWVNDAIQPSHPLFPPSPPASVFSSIRVFSNDSALRIRWPKYWSFSFSISPSKSFNFSLLLLPYSAEVIIEFICQILFWIPQFFQLP